MELRHLRYFLVVGEVLNFTKAAARLRVAQPALSRQIQDLEDEIGVDLLHRSPRGVTLTAEGKLFLEEVRELLKRTVNRWKGCAPSRAVNTESCTLAIFRFQRWRYCRKRSKYFGK